LVRAASDGQVSQQGGGFAGDKPGERCAVLAEVQATEEVNVKYGRHRCLAAT
jgi:hypothetical protein